MSVDLFDAIRCTWKEKVGVRMVCLKSPRFVLDTMSVEECG